MIAKEIAFNLRGDWDGCNSVSFDKNIKNDVVFRTILELAGGSINSYCFQGVRCHINIERGKVNIIRKLHFVLIGFRKFDLVAAIKINNGFQLALEQGLFKPDIELNNKIETFCEYLELGLSKVEASRKAELSWFIIILLEDWGTLID
ncbi:hypothetical protein [Crocosphaera chwakensis]|nr:hypothetical protein [Crocosphaera chwakensis]